MAKESISIKKVAREASVSVGTVSNVLNRPEIVSPERREGVEKAIRKLGYVRNNAARQLKMGRSRTVGAIVLDMGNPFYNHMISGIESAAENLDLMLIASGSGNRTNREEVYLSLYEEQRVRGILLASTGETTDQVQAIRNRGTPIIQVEDPTADGALVYVDHVAGGRIAVEHLLANGRLHIAVILAQIGLRQVAERLEGARSAVEGTGASLEVLEADDLTVLAGRAAGEEIARRSRADRPDAIFCVNDLLAVGVLQAFAFGASIAVPEEIALVGYDDISFSRSTVVPLTTVSQPSALIGWTALELLEEDLSESDSEPPRRVNFTPELVVRESTVS